MGRQSQDGKIDVFENFFHWWCRGDGIQQSKFSKIMWINMFFIDRINYFSISGINFDLVATPSTNLSQRCPECSSSNDCKWIAWSVFNFGWHFNLIGLQNEKDLIEAQAKKMCKKSNQTFSTTGIRIRGRDKTSHLACKNWLNKGYHDLDFLWCWFRHLKWNDENFNISHLSCIVIDITQK